MIKIAIITNIPAPYRVDLFNYLQDNFKNYKFNIIYTNLNEDNRKWNIKYSNLRNSYVLKSKIIKKKQKWDYKYIHVPVGLFNVLKTINPDVVIGFEYNLSALQGLLWCKKNNKKYINLTDGTLHSERNINFIQKCFRKIIIKKSDAYIASSTKAKEKLLYWGAENSKIFISFLTIDTEKFLAKKISNHHNHNLLYVGSFIKRKGLDLLFDALNLVKETFTLKIIGNGTSEEIIAIKDLIAKYNMNNKVVIEEFKTGKELIKEYKNASVFILPSREDCFGLVLVEALCTHTPIISSKYADGAYDTIVNGENGYIIDPYNPLEFSEKISCVLSGSNYDSLSKNCGKYIEKFKFSNVTKYYIEAINFVLKIKE